MRSRQRQTNHHTTTTTITFISTMAGRVGFAVLGNDVDLDARAGKKKGDKNKPKNDEVNKKAAGNKLPNKKKKPAAAVAVPAAETGVFI